MSKKKTEEEEIIGKGGMGGAANDAGSSHRKGVAAYIMVHGIAQRKLSDFSHDHVPVGIALETDDPVDDIRVRFDNNSRAYIQAKRKLDKSIMESSVLPQWAKAVRDGCGNEDILVVVYDSCSDSICKVKQALDSSSTSDGLPPVAQYEKIFADFERWIDGLTSAQTRKLRKHARFVQLQTKDPSRDHAKTAVEILRNCIINPNAAENAYGILLRLAEKHARERSSSSVLDWRDALQKKNVSLLPSESVMANPWGVEREWVSKELAQLYQVLFHAHDPGIPTEAHREPTWRNRFVLPDIEPTPTEVAWGTLEDPRHTGNCERSRDDAHETTCNMSPLVAPPPLSSCNPQPSGQAVVSPSLRRDLDEWLAQTGHTIIVGAPGSGKSALLRFLALELSMPSSKLARTHVRWRDYLVIWQPFAYWTKRAGSVPGGGVMDWVRDWLREWNKESLIPVLERAVVEGKLLLLVDGADEGVSEDVASQVRQRLRVFVETSDTNIILTGRPHGFQHSGGMFWGWDTGYIAPLTTAQQKRLASLWLSLHYRQSRLEDPSHKALVDSTSNAFFAEANSLHVLRSLSQTPLLLSLLLRLKLKRVVLPRGRFEVVDSVVEHLISEHPASRRNAAQVESNYLEDREVRDAMAFMAFASLKDGETVLSDRWVEEKCFEFLSGHDDFCLGLPRAEALRDARRFLEVAEGQLGLLVRQSPHDVSFFHKLVQETLAGYHLSHLSHNAQEQFAREASGDRHWFETILAMCHYTRSHSQVGVILNRISSEGNTSAQLVGAELRAAVAFGAYGCPPKLREQIKQETFRRVEQADWLPHRLRLVDHVFEGIHSQSLQDDVRDRCRAWAVDRVGYARSSAFQELTAWPKEPQTLDLLFAGLHCDEPDVQHAAARSLASMYGGDGKIEKVLSDIAHTTSRLSLRAVAVRALTDGWGNSDATQKTVLAATESDCPVLDFVRIKFNVKTNCQSEDDLHTTLWYSSWRNPPSSYFGYSLPDLLVEGWGGDSNLRDICFGAKDGLRTDGELDFLIAQEVLLRGFPGDARVAKWVIERFNNNERPFVPIETTNWLRWLNESFPDNDLITDCVWDWAQKRGALAAQEFVLLTHWIKTKEVKRWLLDEFDKGSPLWPGIALLEGWGKEDPKVTKALQDVALGDDYHRASMIAPLLPRIELSPHLIQERLLKLLEGGGHGLSANVIHALLQFADTGSFEGSVEDDLIPRCVDLAENTDDWQRVDAESALIRHSPKHADVHRMAKRSLGRNVPPAAALVQAYADSVPMRREVSNLLRPLPVDLRRFLTGRIAQSTDELASTSSWYQDCWNETDGQSLVESSIAIHEHIASNENHNGEMRQVALDRLRAEVVCTGLRFEHRRQAALAGLLILNRADIYEAATDYKGDPITIPLDTYTISTSLLHLIAQRWQDFVSVVGEPFGERTNRTGFSGWFERGLALLAGNYPDIDRVLIAQLEPKPNKIASMEYLHVAARVNPGTATLFERCREALLWRNTGSYGAGELVATAAKLVIEHLKGEEAPPLWIEQAFESEPIPLGALLTLAWGWPRHQLVREQFMRIRMPVREPAPFPVHFALEAAQDEPEGLCTRLAEHLERPTRDGVSGQTIQAVVFPLLLRLRRDSLLVHLLIDRLDVEMPSFRVSVPHMLAQAVGVGPELRDWCVAEERRQLIEIDALEFGFDVVSGDLRSVLDTVRSVLDSA